MSTGSKANRWRSAVRRLETGLWKASDAMADLAKLQAEYEYDRLHLGFSSTETLDTYSRIRALPANDDANNGIAAALEALDQLRSAALPGKRGKR